MMLRFLLSLVVTATRISSASISTHSNEHREILKRHEKGYAALGPAMPADTATALLMEPLWTKALNTSLKAGGIDATGVHSVLNVTILPNSDLNVSIALSSKNPEMSVQFLNKHRHIIREALASVLFMHTSRINAVRFVPDGMNGRRLAQYWLLDTPGFHTEVEDVMRHYRIMFSINLATDQAKFRNPKIQPRKQNAVWYNRYIQMKSRDKTGAPCPPWRTGAGCKQRVCWYGISDTSYNDRKDAAWGPFAGAFGGKHAYKECSGRGTCDRYTGECKCRPDFTGKACQSRKCIKECNGHGMCLPQDWSFMERYQSHPVPLATNLWDLKRFQVCVCDRGYHGLYCQKRFCPRGDDLLTMNEDQTGPQDDSVQRVHFNDFTVGDYFFLTFTDQYNGRYNTEPIRFAGVTGEETRRRVQHALEGLPNLALPTVSIYRDPPTGDIFIKFTDPTTTNIQQLIECTVYTKQDATCESGVQPMMMPASKISAACYATHVKPAKPLKENAVCGNRGYCDETTGKCKCMDGFLGEACDLFTEFW